MKKNQYGFGAIVLIVAIAGFAGWYVWNGKSKTSNQTASTTNNQKQESSTTADNTTYDSAKTSKIKNFDAASDTLKEALINSYYEDAKNNCDQENSSLSADARLDYVMTVQKMVRNDFAGVQLCGSGGTSIMAYVDGEWKIVGSLAMAPACSIVDQYKISKEIASTCYVDGTSNMRDVTYP